ncbi:hypothetical protein [Achromobacter xylosoxidans]|uniref:hypothetical protein n=1 Tax=Alcaligenes xylosoxydans xylosoxydans TaxID=85698 RepID=UPI001F141D7C|nr:hypothetical protein [Achromobacter xylosoxidans]
MTADESLAIIVGALMGILGLIGFVIVLGCFGVMSRTSRILLALLLGASLYYWYSISAVFHGGSGPDMGELKVAMTLLSANIGGFVVAAVLGIMQKSSTSPAHYATRKKAFFTFLAKWGLIYGAYTFAGSKLIDLALGGDDVGWLFMRVWGLYGFIALLLLWFFFRPKKAT